MRTYVLALAALAALAVLTSIAAADATPAPQAPPMMMPPAGPDPLTPYLGMLGNWEGDGTSTFGPFHAKWSGTRAGAWITSVSHIFAQGQEVESVTQLMGVGKDGKLVSYSFDSSGVAMFSGTASADGKSGSFHSADGDEFRDFSWTANADGTVTSSYTMHDPSAKAPYPVDFHVDETDHRVP